MSTTTLRAYLDDVAGLLEQQALEEVIGHCRHILQHFPKNLETYRILGQSLLEKNRHQEASDVFQRVLGALPDDFKAHIGMSACWEELQQLPRAIWHMERAFEVDPNNRALQDELKRLLERNRQTPPARFTLSRAALSRIYFNGKLYEQAISELQSALPQAPDRYDLQVLYAQALWNAEHVTQATEQALLVLETLPDSLYANRIMAELWLRASRPSDAKPYFTKVEQLDPFVAWEMLHQDGEAVPRDAFKLPRLQWDVRAAAALATGTPDWMAAIGEVFVDPESVDLSVPSEKRKRVWLDDFGAPANQSAAQPSKPRTGKLIDKYTGDEPPAEQDDVPDWFKEVEKESGKQKRSTSLNSVVPVWGDDAPRGSTPALSVNTPDQGTAQTADADWLFDGSDEVPPIPPADAGESLEVRAADALSWLQTDDQAAAGPSDADWLFGEEESTPAAPAANNDMPDTLDWLLDESPPTPKLNKLPTGDLPAPDVENSADALAWLQTGSLSPDKLPTEPADEVKSLPADAGEINSAAEALSWLETGPLSPDAVTSEAPPDMDWLLDEASAPSIPTQAAQDVPSTMFVDPEDNSISTRKVTTLPPPVNAPVDPPTSWGDSTPTDNENTSEAFAAWLDANPPPVPSAQPSDGQGWMSELQISDALDAEKLKSDADADVTIPPMVQDIADSSDSEIAAAPTLPVQDSEMDEFALMFDNIDVNAALGDLPLNTPPSLPLAEPEEDPMAWAMNLGLDLPAGDVAPADDMMDDFSPMEQGEQDPLAWMREAGIEPPPELSFDNNLKAETTVEGEEANDDDAFMASLGSDIDLDGIETGLDIQSTLFAPEQNVQTISEAPAAEAEPAPAPAPEPLLDLSDPDWLNDFNPIEVPEDEQKPTMPTGSLASPLPPESGLDWLSAFGGATATDAQPASEVEAEQGSLDIDIGWLNQTAADQVAAMGSQAFAMPESKPEIDVPATPTPPPPAAELPKADAEDWLAGFGIIEDELPLSVTPVEAEALPQSLEDAFSLESLLGDEPSITTPDVPNIADVLGAPTDTPVEEPEANSWLSSLGFDLDAEDAGEATPAATLPAEPVEVDDTPDWLTGVAPLDLPQPQHTDVASSAEDFSSFLDAFTPEAEVTTPADPRTSTDALVGDSIDWLSALGTPETAAAETAQPDVAANDDNELDSMLDSFTSATATTPTTATATPEPSADLGLSNLDWLNDLSAAGTDQAAEQGALSIGDDFGDILNAFTADAPSVPTATSTPVATPEPSADLGLSNLDWLNDLSVVDADQAATEEPVAAMDDDFGNILNAFTPETPSADVTSPDWLNDLSIDVGANQPAAVEQPAASVDEDFGSFLDAFKPEETPATTPTTTPSAGFGATDWLADLAPANETPPTQPAAVEQSASTGNAGDMDFGGFLNDLTDIGGVETSSEQPTAAITDDFDNWLPPTSAPAVKSLDALDFSSLPSAEPDPDAPDLSALMADLGVQPDAVPSSTQSEGEANIAPGALPDWMAAIVPPTEANEPEPPSEVEMKRTTTPMDAVNPQSIEPPSSGPSSTGFTDLLRDLKAGARPISPPTGMLPPMDEPTTPIAAESPAAESDWLAAFIEPEAEATNASFDAFGTTTDDAFKLELDAALAPGDLTIEPEDEAITSTASFDIDSVTDLDLGTAAPEPSTAGNEDWLSNLGFTDEVEATDDAATPVLTRLTAEPEPAAPSAEKPEDDNWFGAMFADNTGEGEIEADASEQESELPVEAEPTMSSSSLFARLNQPPEPAAETDTEIGTPSVLVDAEAPDWLREMGESSTPAVQSDQVYNAKPVAPTPDSGNTSQQEEKSSSGFALPKRAPRWSRSGKTGDLDPDTLHQPRFAQQLPAVPPEPKPEVPPEKKPANTSDDDFSNLLNSLLDDTDTDLSDLLK